MHKAVLLAITAATVLAPARAEELDRVAPQLAAPKIGDLPEMKERRVIRVLVTPNKTEYFVIKGQERGFEFELMEQYEAFVNKGTKRDELRINMVYIPTPFDELLPDLVQGRGDIAAVGLTTTAQRKTKVNFTEQSIAPESRVHFSLAAYNAGPAKVRQMRTRMTRMRLDSNRWFGNVERAALAMVGRETPRYVSNVYKYYLAYTLLGSIDQKKAAELKSKTE